MVQAQQFHICFEFVFHGLVSITSCFVLMKLEMQLLPTQDYIKVARIRKKLVASRDRFTANLLQKYCYFGIYRGAAREKVLVEKYLEQMIHIEDAFASGAIS
jgi:hypothetical protein